MHSFFRQFLCFPWKKNSMKKLNLWVYSVPSSVFSCSKAEPAATQGKWQECRDFWEGYFCFSSSTRCTSSHWHCYLSEVIPWQQADMRHDPKRFPSLLPSVLYSSSHPLAFPYLMNAIMCLSHVPLHLCEESSPITAWVRTAIPANSSKYPVKNLKPLPSTGMMNQGMQKVSHEALCPEL